MTDEAVSESLHEEAVLQCCKRRMHVDLSSQWEATQMELLTFLSALWFSPVLG